MARRLSALSSFYKWAAKHEIATGDPVALADKPKAPAPDFGLAGKRRAETTGGDGENP